MTTIRATSKTAPLSLAAVLFLIQPLTANAQQVVGAVGAVNASATGRAPNHAARGLAPGGPVFFKDRISTKSGGSAQLTFLDRSTLNVGENSDVVIDEFVYRPADGVGGMSASLTKGVLRFVGGDISHGGGTVFKTPVVTIGIRGGIGTIVSLPEGGRVRDIPGVPDTFHGGTIVINGFGSLTIRNAVSEQIVSRPGFAVFVGAANAPIAAPVRFDMSAIKTITARLTSRVNQNGGGAARPVASGSLRLTTQLPVIDIPIAIPLRPAINGLDFTATVSAGSAVTKARAQAQRSLQVQQQISAAPAIPMPVKIAPSPASTTPTMVATPTVPGTVATPIAVSPPAPSTVSIPSVTTTAVPIAVTQTVSTSTATSPVTAPTAAVTTTVAPIAVTQTVSTSTVKSAVTTPIAAATNTVAPIDVTPTLSTPAVKSAVTTPVATVTTSVTPIAVTPTVSTPAVKSAVTTPVAAVTTAVPAVTTTVSTSTVTSTVAKPASTIAATVATAKPTITVATTKPFVATTISTNSDAGNGKSNGGGDNNSQGNDGQGGNGQGN